jgi:alpha-galactosidase
VEVLAEGEASQCGRSARGHGSWCAPGAPVPTKSILLNREVIAVDQDPLGKAATRVSVDGEQEVWARPLVRDAFAVGLFNRGTTAAEIRVKWSDLKLTGAALRVRDLWAKTDRGMFKDEFVATVPPHGVAMLRLSR